MLQKTKFGGFVWVKPVFSAPLSFEEQRQLSPEAAQAYMDWVFARGEVKCQRRELGDKRNPNHPGYLDGDYELVDGKPEYVWSEGEI